MSTPEPKKKPVTANEPLRFELFAENEEAPKKTQQQNGNALEIPLTDHEIKHTEDKIPAQQKTSKIFLSKPKNIYAEAPFDQTSQPVIKEDLTINEQIPETVIKVQPVEQQSLPEKIQPFVQQQPLPEKVQPAAQQQPLPEKIQLTVQQQPLPEKEPENAKMVFKEEPVSGDNTDLQLVIKEEELPKTQPVFPTDATLDDLLNNEEEEQKRRAAERISKLRNLSFNMNSADANTEYDNVPAYVRRNMELFGNTLTSVEQFYSKYTVKKDENEETKISTINTFLDGKKPD
jgi:cell division protein FtsZ